LADDIYISTSCVVANDLKTLWYIIGWRRLIAPQECAGIYLKKGSLSGFPAVRADQRIHRERRHSGYMAPPNA